MGWFYVILVLVTFTGRSGAFDDNDRELVDPDDELLGW